MNISEARMAIIIQIRATGMPLSWFSSKEIDQMAQQLVNEMGDEECGSTETKSPQD